MCTVRPPRWAAQMRRKEGSLTMAASAAMPRTRAGESAVHAAEFLVHHGFENEVAAQAQLEFRECSGNE